MGIGQPIVTSIDVDSHYRKSGRLIPPPMGADSPVLVSTIKIALHRSQVYFHIRPSLEATAWPEAPQCGQVAFSIEILHYSMYL